MGCFMRLGPSVYAWFTEGFDTRDHIDAKKLLDELTYSILRTEWPA